MDVKEKDMLIKGESLINDTTKRKGKVSAFSVTRNA